MIWYFKVNKDITQDLEKFKKNKPQNRKVWPLVVRERDQHVITHLAIWTLYFNLLCPLEDFQEDVRHGAYIEQGGKHAKRGKAGRI